ncbi:hypothetical protein E2C01_073614 [Portunus trituberculatus]|uniref:Uncharacterized protein n=1 Tax=Portunus trituberculatus TaxID=210409 RepID=A0A5B7I148_PORTR|nr:hypothetical protein [Portunus trituberculatus]
MVNEIHYTSNEDLWPTFRTSLVRLQESPSSSSSSSCPSCSFGYTGSSSSSSLVSVGEKGDDVWLRVQSSWLPPHKVRSVVASPSEHHSLSSRAPPLWNPLPLPPQQAQPGRETEREREAGRREGRAAIFTSRNATTRTLTPSHLQLSYPQFPPP